MHTDDTMPLHLMGGDVRPTFKQFRQCYNASCETIAQHAHIHPVFVKRLESGTRVEAYLALRVFTTLSHYAGRQIRFEEIRGIRIKGPDGVKRY